MTQWRVDPDGVLGVLAGVDELGPQFVSAHTEITDAAMMASTLEVDGRTTLSNAWESFLDTRSLVPGKIMTSIARASSALSSATTAVTTGDDEMADSTRAAAEYAQSIWGIAPAHAYVSSIPGAL